MKTKKEESGQRGKGILLSYLQTVLHLIASLLYVPILLRVIGKNEYGVYQLAGSVIVYGVFSAWIFGMIRYILGGAL